MIETFQRWAGTGIPVPVRARHLLRATFLLSPRAGRALKTAKSFFIDPAQGLVHFAQQVRSMLTPHLRLATEADTGELARLRWDFSPDEVAASGQSFAEFEAAFRAFWLNALASGNWAAWVAEESGRLVATLWVQVIHKVPRPGRFAGHNRYGYVTNVYTEPEFRGRGIGSQLLARTIAWAGSEELEFLVLWPSEESVSFYERAGFGRSPDALELHFEA